MTPVTPELLERARAVRLAVFDVDGVMTDGRLYFSDEGIEIKAFHSRDGLGLKALMRHGIDVAVITARQSKLVARRMQDLGISHLMQGREDKLAAIESLLAERSISFEQTAYTGDDLIDWPAMSRCQLKCAPADASPWICHQADFVTERPGGLGAAREVCELILEAHGQLKSWQDSYR